jgi:hypothetical protein
MRRRRCSPGERASEQSTGERRKLGVGGRGRFLCGRPASALSRRAQLKLALAGIAPEKQQSEERQHRREVEQGDHPIGTFTVFEYS